MSSHRAIVDGQDKGEVYKKAARWRWQRGADAAATEFFGRGTTIGDVKNFIKRVCRTEDVRIIKSD